jgi:hypothetical protein
MMFDLLINQKHDTWYSQVPKQIKENNPPDNEKEQCLGSNENKISAA